MPNETLIYDLPFPIDSDPVDVASDIQALAERIEAVLPSLGLPYFTHEVRNNSGAIIAKGDPVYVTGFSTKTTVAKSLGNTLATFPVIGLATTSIANGSDGVVIVSGVFSDVNTSSYTAGNILYVATAGGLTTTQPTTGSGAVGVVLKANATTGVILVLGSKGNGTWGAVKAGL
jgi:predicted RecA/RadA family phage recombinase